MDENYPVFLTRCLELADEAGKVGESAVGCVIVKNDRIIGEGQEQSQRMRDITRHAEMVAILDALKKENDLSEAVLYTNVEPCLLCSYAIRHYRIKKVIFIRHSGELGGTANPYNLLTTDKIKSWGTPPEVIVYDAKNEIEKTSP